MKTNAIEYWV